MFEQMQPRVRGNVSWLAVLGMASSLWVLPASCAAAGVEISDGGSASYTYEIGLPPARGGFQPKLSLRYSSNGPSQGLQALAGRSRACPPSRAALPRVRSMACRSRSTTTTLTSCAWMASA